MIAMNNPSHRQPSRALPGILLAMALSACTQSSPDAESAEAVDGQVAPSTVLAPLPPERVAERADPTDFCSLDTVDGSLFKAEAANPVADPSRVRLTGWIGHRATLARPDMPVLRVESADGARGWEIALGAPVARGDVARHFDAATMQQSGFDDVVDLSVLPPGEYGLSLGYQYAGRRVECDKGRRIVVGG